MCRAVARYVQVGDAVSTEQAPGFARQTAVINGCFDLILALFGPDVGRHARSAVGMAALLIRL